MSAGFDGYLQKPVCRSVLFQELFRFIPRSAEEKIPKEPVNYANIIFENVTILIADDVEDNRSLLREFFQDMNIRIIEVEDGLQAVAAAEQALPDVILMDIRMPVMDGYEAVKQIRKNRKSENIPVIAVTGHAMTGEKKAITDAGFDSCISKPFRLATLFQELSRFIPYTVKKGRH